MRSEKLTNPIRKNIVRGSFSSMSGELSGSVGGGSSHGRGNFISVGPISSLASPVTSKASIHKLAFFAVFDDDCEAACTSFRAADNGGEDQSSNERAGSGDGDADTESGVEEGWGNRLM